MPRANMQSQHRERVAYEMRQLGHSWHYIAQHLWGTTRESTARAAAKRYAQRTGLPVFGDPRLQRTEAAHVATAARWGAPGIQPPPLIQPLAGARTFGVEIEFETGHRLTIAEALDQVVGYHVHMTSYHGTRCSRCGGTVDGYTGWKVETDGTVTRGDYGGEVVSPVLQGEEGLDQVAAVMTAIKAHGGRITNNCGMHVHLGARDMSGHLRAGLLKGWVFHYHDMLDKMVAPHRVGNYYTQRFGAAEANRHIRELQAGHNPQQPTKMRTLNLTPLARIGTMEVRYHQGCLRPREMRAWIGYLIGLFDYHAQTDQPLPTNPEEHLNKLVELGLLLEVRANHLKNNIRNNTLAAAAA